MTGLARTAEHASKKELNKDGNIAGSPDIIWTYTDHTIKPLDPNPANIYIEDIAHALSMQCRFTGHTKYFYSVAEHVVHCSYMVSSEVAFETINHDDSEAYLADLARPIKHQPGFGDTYREAEKRLEAAIAVRFGLVYPFPAEVYEADNQMLFSEVHALMPQSFRDAFPTPAPGTPEPSCWSPTLAEERFLDRFIELGGADFVGQA